MDRDLKLIGVIVLAPAFTGWFGGAAQAQDPAEFFRQNCVSCHTIGGGRLTGPDLKNVTQRKERAWLIEFLQNPPAMIERGDPYALKLLQEARGVVMPAIVGMTRQRAEELLALIEAESRLEKSQFVGLQITDRPFTRQEVAEGRRIFLGYRKLAANGPACLGCHSLEAIAGLGGGRLGPDLTRVYERLQGRKNLAAWLMAPATPTMQAVFRQGPLRPEEVLLLVALFEDSVRGGRESSGAGLLLFFLAGLGGTVLALILFDAAWRRRFRAVRRVLVHPERVRGAQ